MPLDHFTDTADIAESAIGGWRYVFSHNYRLKKHRQWRDDWLSAFFEVLFGVFGVAVTAGLVGLAGHAFWRWLHP